MLRRFIGFEELGNSDEFETATLEWKLLNSGQLYLHQDCCFELIPISGVIQKDESFSPSVTYGAKPTVRQHIRGRETRDDDSDFDLDD